MQPISASGEEMVTTSDKTGSFCFQAAQGLWVLTADLYKDEIAHGVKIDSDGSENGLWVMVGAHPILDFEIRQEPSDFRV